MKSKYTAHYSLLLVVLAHIGILAAVLFAPESTTPLEIIPPTIQGVIVAAEPIAKPPEPLPPPPPPPPEQKPLPKPKIPLPKAPPSEHAIKQESEPEPTPPAPIPVEPKPVVQQAPVTPPQADASQINNPAPVYPVQSQRLREEGTVILEIMVLADGSVAELRLKTSSGYARLDEAALRAVKNWHFIAAKRGDESIDYLYELPVQFALNK